ncbi:MAG: phosphatase PAP2 family protein [Rhizomicrobium sp.]
MEHLNTEIVVYLNGLLRSHFWLAKLASGLALNPIARGVPVFVPLMVLWFSKDHFWHRGRMLVGVAGVCLATLISVLLQKHLHVDIRPFFDPKLHLYLVNREDLSQWGRINSFPSDTATLYFALSTVVFLEWRLGGSLAYGWSFVTAGVCRAALGFHYPTDILAGIALGVGMAWLFVNWHVLAAWVQRQLVRFDSRAAWIHAVFFLFLADAWSLFPGLQGVMRFFTFLGKHW